MSAVAAEVPELEARWRECLTYVRPPVVAATEDPQGRRDINLFERDCLQHIEFVCLRVTS